MNGRLKGWIVGVSAIAAVAAGVGMASAADESENVIKYRQNVMRSIGGHTGAIAAVVKGEVSFGAHVAAHAGALAATSQQIVDMFPEGTLTGAETRAKPEIWQDWDDFRAKAGDLQSATSNLAQVRHGGDRGCVRRCRQGLRRLSPTVPHPRQLTASLCGA